MVWNEVLGLRWVFPPFPVWRWARQGVFFSFYQGPFEVVCCSRAKYVMLGIR